MLMKPSQPIDGFHLLAIAGVALLAMLPAFLFGIFNAHDLVPCHLVWAKQFSDQFWKGDFYPRWLLNMNAGLGCPTFFFYAPIPYYFTSLLRPLIFVPDPIGWHELSLGAYLGLAASGVTAYLWLSNWINPRVGLLGALLYMLAPYHLAIDLYARFTYGEFWSFVWFPLLLLFSQKLIEGRKVAIVGFAIVEALLIMTHLPSFLIFFPVPLLYVLWNASRKVRTQALIGIALSVIISVGLAAIYWVPAMTTQSYVSLEPPPEVAKYAFFGNNYLFGTRPQWRASFWIYLEVTIALTLGVSICAFLIARRHPEAQIRRQSHFWVAIAIISCLMQVPLSYPVWLLFPPLQKVEVPWRFGLVQTFAMVALVALALLSLRTVWIWNRRTITTTVAFLVFGSTLAGLSLLPALKVRPAFNDALSVWNQLPVKLLWLALVLGVAIALARLKFPIRLSYDRVFAVGVLLGIALFVSSAAPIRYYLSPAPILEAQLAVKYDAPAHRPRWMPKALYTIEQLPQLVRDRFGTSYTANNRNPAEVQQWEPRNLVLQTNETTDLWLTVRQFYYPGWTAMLTKTSEQLEVRPSVGEGLLQIRIPSGKHQIRLVLEALPQERIGQGFTLVSAVITLLLWLWFGGREIVSAQKRVNKKESTLFQR